MGIIDRLRGRRSDEEVRDATISIGQWVQQMNYAGQSYAFVPQQTLPGQPQTEISQNFAGYIQGVYKQNGVVFACMLARQMIFSEARFQFQQMRNGQPGDLFGTQDLQILERPWVNGTTGDLLGRMMMDADLEGNFYAYKDGAQLRRMRPDWVSIAVGSRTGLDRDAEIIGYGYHEGGYSSGKPPVVMLPEEVAHYAPIPDPSFRFRGMSWLTPIIREVMADNAMTEHKLKYLENGATPNMVVSLDPALSIDKFNEWVQRFKERHEGFEHAYKTLYMGGGATANVVGSNFAELSFKEVQGMGETRIAAAARVPAIIVGLSEGLASATYSNFAQARRSFGDMTMRPLWRQACAALEPLINVPGGATLWYDDRHVSFLREDQADAASILATNAATMSNLITAGFDPDTVVTAVNADDMSLLKHTHLFSVQLQPTPTPEMFAISYAASYTDTHAQTIKALIDSGFEPESAIEAVNNSDLTLLVPGLEVQLSPAATVSQGKGSLVGGAAVPVSQPAQVGQNTARALLGPWLPHESEDEDGE